MAVRDRDTVYKLTSDDGVRFSPAVYDWREDPEERRNLYDPEDPSQSEMVAKLERYKDELTSSYQTRRRGGRWSAKRRAELPRSLGYVD